MTIRAARFPEECELVRTLFREYAAEIVVNLCFQGFEQELAALPGAYVPPTGELLLAEHAGEVVGCVAVRELKVPACGCGSQQRHTNPDMATNRLCHDAGSAGETPTLPNEVPAISDTNHTSRGPKFCEMKRLYVRPAARGSACGRKLADAIVAVSRRLGYSHMRLDTLATMTAARGLYRSLGFVEIDAYYDNPLDDVVYMELQLAGPRITEPRQ